jgi:hypothetical protein
MSESPATAATFAWKGHAWERRTRPGGPTFNGQWLAANVHDPTADGVAIAVSNPSGRSPHAAEFYSHRTGWGYGTYQAVIAARLDTLHASIVLGGMFLYDAANPPAHGEVDAGEVSAWDRASAPPSLSHTYWFDHGGVGTPVSAAAPATPHPVQTHTVAWTPGSLAFRAYAGAGTGGELILESAWTAHVPTPNTERVHFNIWVFDRHDGAGATATPTEVVIRDFRFEPYCFAAEPRPSPLR